MPSTSWLVVHPKVVASSIGGTAMVVLTAYLQAHGHEMPADVQAALTAAAASLFGWLVPNK